jgi:hypothetical protein
LKVNVKQGDQKMKSTQTISLAPVVFMVLTVMGCGDIQDGIPKPYRGVFQSREGAQLDVVSEGAQIQIGKKTIVGRAQPVNFKSLYEGKSGFYNRLAQKNSTVMDVYWITPDPESKVDWPEGNRRIYDADILHFQINIAQKQVDVLQIVHSSKGQITLDTRPLQDPNVKLDKIDETHWAIGWQARPEEFTFTRTAAKSETNIPKDSE